MYFKMRQYLCFEMEVALVITDTAATMIDAQTTDPCGDGGWA